MVRLRERLEHLRQEVAALSIAARDPRTPWSARLVGALAVGLALSPIDPIPDFVPVLGYVDDLVLVPLGVALAWRLTPRAVREAARERATEAEPGRARWFVCGLVVLGWLATLGWLALELPTGW